MTATILSGLLGGIFLGLVLIVIAWRGKRLNDHPICRSCQFDLLGIVPEGVTCPECGAGLKRPNAFRTGARRKRLVMMAMGAVMVFLPIAAIGTVGFGMLTGKDFNTYKPTWVLIWEGKHLGAEASQLAATELESRTFKSGADPDMVAMIVQAALEIQGDVEQPWTATWGDIIVGAIASDTLSEADAKRYYDQGIAVEIETRLRASAGGTLPVVLRAVDGRVAGGSMLMGMVFLDECTLDGQQLKQVRPEGFPAYVPFEPGGHLGWVQVYGATMAAGWGTGGTMVTGQGVTTLEVPKDIAPGRHMVHVSMAISTFDQQAMQGDGYAWPTEADENSRRVEGDFEIEVVAEGVSTVLSIAATPDMTAQMTDAISISLIEIYAGGLLSSGQANVAVTFMEPPEEVACDVFVKQGEREWPLGSLTTGTLAAQDMGGGWYQDDSTVNVSGSVSGLKSGTASVILRPSAEVAARTIDISRYYGGEIVISEVDVQNYGGSTGFLGALFQHFTEQAAIKAVEAESVDETEGEAEKPDSDKGVESETPETETGSAGGEETGGGG